MARASLRPGEQELPAGTRLLDRYSILDWVGSGGMATIYRATDDRLDRVVCIKLLRTLVEGPETDRGSRAVYQATYTHFLKEALALSKLQHPNTLRIYDFGYMRGDRDGVGAPFHVSEFLDGGNLETRVRDSGPLPAHETLGILLPISAAIAEAHEQGILHRDIKPSNILFARVRGELVPKLADFGIAHSNVTKSLGPADESFGESVSTVALFSPRWAAPEQLCGTPEDPRTDVYALGLLAVFMLTGKVLFADEDVRATFEERVRGDSLVLSRLAQVGLSAEIRHVIERALQVDPDRRTPTAPDFAAQLRAVLEPPPSRTSSGSLDRASRPTLERASIPPPRPSAPSLGSQAELRIDGPEGPVEHVVMLGGRRLRYVQVFEKLDLSFTDPAGGTTRFRVTMLPGQSTTVNVKGLSCFVAKRGGRTTPALTAHEDCSVELVSAARQVLGEVTVQFGEGASKGRVFVLDGRQLLVTYREAQQAIVLALSHGSDIVVMCRS